MAALAVVTVFSVACDESGGSSGIPDITTSGGLGGNNGGRGGNAGDFDIEIDYGTGGHIVMSSSGGADANFSPSSFTPWLGTNPLVITTDTTIERGPVAPPAVDVAYIDAADNRVYISDGDATFGNLDADEDPVTGISVDAAATLTFGVAANANVTFIIDADFFNEGTVTTADQAATDRGNLDMTVGSFINRGTIALHATAAGQNGGDFDVEADAAAFVNQGPILTYGGDADGVDAGDGGSLDLYGEHFVENTALIDSHGGNATGVAGVGGDAGQIYVEADLYGDIRNSGAIDASGGDGITGGGDGDNFEMYVEYTGDCVNTGDMDLTGGDTQTGTGGDGGDYDCETWQGGAYIAGTINARGGSASDPAGSGGDGGGLEIDLYSGSSYEPTPGEYSPNKDLEFSARVDLRGGDAVATGTGSGGDGGDFDLALDGEYFPRGQEVRVLGTSLIEMRGGDGNDGGNGGDVDLFQEYAYDDDTYFPPAGFAISGVTFDTRGGSVVEGAVTVPSYGGSGGDVDIYTSTYAHYSVALVGGQEPPELNFRGRIDARGGTNMQGDMSPNDGGDVWLYGPAGVSVRGDIMTRGGDDAATVGGWGGDGGDVDLLADYGDVSIRGTIDMRGGDGAFRGGDAGGWDTASLATSEGDASSGDILADGGHADPAIAGSTGGTGGDIWLFSPDGPQGVSHGELSAAGGDGETAGTDGEIIAGGFLMAP